MNNCASDGDTIIDTVFVLDAPKFKYKEKIAPHHAGNSYKKLKEHIEKRPTRIVRDHEYVADKIKPVIYPYRSVEAQKTSQQQAGCCNVNHAAAGCGLNR